MKNVEILEKGRILKDCLRIVDKLAKNDLADIDGEFTNNDFDVDELQKLIIMSRKLKRSRWWSLT